MNCIPMKAQKAPQRLRTRCVEVGSVDPVEQSERADDPGEDREPPYPGVAPFVATHAVGLHGPFYVVPVRVGHVHGFPLIVGDIREVLAHLWGDSRQAPKDLALGDRQATERQQVPPQGNECLQRRNRGPLASGSSTSSSSATSKPVPNRRMTVDEGIEVRRAPVRRPRPPVPENASGRPAASRPHPRARRAG